MLRHEHASGAATLQNKVRAHVAEVAQVVLGPNHPISVLLALPLPSGDPLYISGLVIKCLRDAMVNIFGENGYQTRFYEIAAAQNFAQTSQTREAELIFTKLINGISLQFGSEAAFTVYMEFERDKVYQQSPSSSLSQFTPSSVKNDPDSAFLKVERAFGAYNLSLAFHMQRQSPEAAPLEIPTWRIDLARYLFHRRRYALALHLCGIGCFEELSFYNPQVIDSVDILLADRVADTLRDAFHLQAKPTTFPGGRGILIRILIRMVLNRGESVFREIIVSQSSNHGVVAGGQSRLQAKPNIILRDEIEIPGFFLGGIGGFGAQNESHAISRMSRIER